MSSRQSIRSLQELDREELLAYIENLAKRWLSHDGLWFLTVEDEYGLNKAIELDCRTWAKFTVLEAKRIMKFLGLEPGGGLDTLETALNFRLYATINTQTSERPDEKTLLFTMNNCRVQEARKRKKLPDFPCKPVGLAEYANFARTIDERIKTKCIFCPPDSHPQDAYCRWRFAI